MADRWYRDLPDAIRAAGLRVWVDPGYATRGHGGMGELRGILVHHTAGGGSRDWLTVRDGRPGLAGPLAQLTVERDGLIRVLAAGQCYHAGTGTHPRVGTNVGNYRLLGIEGVSPGVGSDAWTPEQEDVYPRLCAALCRWYGLPPESVIFHLEWATPRGRKIDAAGELRPPERFRQTVARRLAELIRPTPTPDEEDDMAGALAYELPAGQDRKITLQVPPSDGAGAAAGAKVWVSLVPGFEPVTVHYSRLVTGRPGGDVIVREPITIPALGRWGSAEGLPAGTRSIELRYSTAADQSVLVEWRKL